jgi:hypothetical protein
MSAPMIGSLRQCLAAGGLEHPRTIGKNDLALLPG